MILKLRTRERGHDLGWTYIDGVTRVDVIGPISNEDGTQRAFESHADVVDWAKEYWGEQAFNNLSDHFAFVIWPNFRLGRAGGGGQPDAYTLSQATVWVTDERIGLAFLTQDDAYLMSDTGATIDRLR